jgi:hypothetical protein
VGPLVALILSSLLLPSGLAALGGYRDLVLITTALPLAGTAVLLLLPLIALLGCLRICAGSPIGIDPVSCLGARALRSRLLYASSTRSLSSIRLVARPSAGLVLPMPDAPSCSGSDSELR